jgi:hypothetical protein
MRVQRLAVLAPSQFCTVIKENSLRPRWHQGRNAEHSGELTEKNIYFLFSQLKWENRTDKETHKSYSVVVVEMTAQNL